MVVYIITNKINGKCYIGKTIKSLKVRWTCHKWLARSGSNTYLHNAMRKYGIANFEIESLLELNSDKELLDWEVELIGMFKSNFSYNGYNLTIGGGGISGHHHSTETLAKMRKYYTVHTPWNKGKSNIYSKETKELMGASKVGNKYRKGCTMSEKSKVKNRNAHLGNHPSEETRMKMSASAKKQWATNPRRRH